MSFLERKMFANGRAVGPPNPIGAFEIRDLTTGEILIDLRTNQDFINNPEFNPYKILSDPTLEKGPAVLSILQNFQKQDAPKLGPFQADEDIGTNLADLGFGAARFTEPFVRGGSRVLGELTGLQAAKDFGGTQEFDPTFSMMPGPIPGVDLFKESYESYVPTDADRARTQIKILQESEGLKEQARPFFENLGQLAAEKFNLGYPLRNPNYNIQSELENLSASTKDVVDKANVEEVIDPTRTGTVEVRNISEDDYNNSERALLQQEMEIVGRDKEGNPLPGGKLLQNPEIEDLLDEIKPAELKVNVDKTEADSIFDTEATFAGLGKEELKKEQEPDLISLEDLLTGDEDVVTPTPIVPETSDPITKKLDEPGFFGSNRFLDFIRNVGGELSRTGQMDEGLSLGAAKAAEERAARELMAEQDEKDFASKLRLAKAEAALAGLEGPSDSMKKELRKVGQEMNADYNDIVSSNNTLEIVARVEEIVNNEDTTSAKAFLGELLEKGAALFNGDGAVSKTGKSFEDLEPRTRAKVLLNQIKQKNIRDILGESGKTISNLDRQIVEELVGSIAAGNTPQEILEALRLTKESIFNNLNSAQNRLKTNAFFAQNEGGMYLVSKNKTIIDYLETGILPSTLYNNAYENQSVRKIKLKEEEEE